MKDWLLKFLGSESRLKQLISKISNTSLNEDTYTLDEAVVGEVDNFDEVEARTHTELPDNVSAAENNLEKSTENAALRQPEPEIYDIAAHPPTLRLQGNKYQDEQESSSCSDSKQSFQQPNETPIRRSRRATKRNPKYFS